MDSAIDIAYHFNLECTMDNLVVWGEEYGAAIVLGFE